MTREKCQRPLAFLHGCDIRDTRPALGDDGRRGAEIMFVGVMRCDFSMSLGAPARKYAELRGSVRSHPPRYPLDYSTGKCQPINA
jgi:hypothetical protein